MQKLIWHSLSDTVVCYAVWYYVLSDLILSSVVLAILDCSLTQLLLFPISFDFYARFDADNVTNAKIWHATCDWFIGISLSVALWFLSYFLWAWVWGMRNGAKVGTFVFVLQPNSLRAGELLSPFMPVFCYTSTYMLPLLFFVFQAGYYQFFFSFSAFPSWN